MKKTYNINLGGIAFIIDENAFEVLFSYLEALKRKFSNEAERKEILNDIEARMAELLLQKMANRKEVVGMEEVEFLIAQMGRPEDIAGDEPTVEPTQQQAASATASAATIHVQKRLFRDTDNEEIGGVIAGLCHYFGIQDPTWARIAAVILLIMSFGTTLFIYILLVIIIPEANTAAEKLQMKGEPINVNTIEKEVKDAANRFTDTMNNTGNRFFRKLWGATSEIGKLVIRFIALLLVIGALCGLIGVFIGFIMLVVFGTTPFNPVSLMVVDQAWLVSAWAFGFLMFLGAPAVAAIYVGLRVLIGRGSAMPWLKWALLTGWLLGLMLLSYSGYKTARDFVSNGTIKEQVPLMQPATGNLFVQLADSTESGWVPVDPENDDDEDDMGNIFLNGENLDDMTSFKAGRPVLELIASENDSFYLQKLVSSQGRNKTNAQQNARMVVYTFRQTDSIVNLKKHFEIPKKGGKFRSQEMKLRLAIPEGKTVRFAGNVDEWSAIVKDDNYYDYTPFANTTWTVENGKVKCLDCIETTRDEDNDLERTINAAKDSLSKELEKAEKKVEAISRKLESDNGDINEDY